MVREIRIIQSLRLKAFFILVLISVSYGLKHDRKDFCFDRTFTFWSLYFILRIQHAAAWKKGKSLEGYKSQWPPTVISACPTMRR